jgi:hypothetical protein
LLVLKLILQAWKRQSVGRRGTASVTKGMGFSEQASIAHSSMLCSKIVVHILENEQATFQAAD